MTKVVTVGICLMVSLAVTLVVKMGVIPGISPEIDAMKTAAEDRAKNEETVAGTIIDTDGNRLAYSDTAGGKRQYIDQYMYSSLFSFHSGGLEYLYYDELYSHGEEKYESKEGEIYYRGDNIELTIDHELSKKAYGLIKEKPDASIVVIDKDGAVRCMVSSKSFNIESINGDYTNYNDGDLLNPAKDYLAPCGSVIKPIIGEVITDYGVNDELVVNDEGAITLDSGETIRNAEGKSYGKIMLKKAMRVSSNVFFISAAKYMGADILNERYGEMCIGENIETDFGRIKSTRIEPDSEYELAMNAIGQNMGVSTVHLAMVTQAVTTGEVNRPYMVEKIVTDTGEVIKRGKKKVIANTSASQDTMAHVNDILKECADTYGITGKTAGIEVLAKTGTAEVETESGGRNIATMILAFPADAPEYFVTIQSRNTEQHGRDLKDIAISLIKEID